MRSLLRGSLLPLMLLLLFFAAYVLYPLAMMIVESLRTTEGLSLQRYAEVLDPANRGNVEAAVNSVMVWWAVTRLTSLKSASAFVPPVAVPSAL